MNRYCSADSCDSEAGTVTVKFNSHNAEHNTMLVNRSYTKLSRFLYNKDLEQLQVLINRVYDNM
jgi:hypothetical protein